ncbi:MAG: fluoride efflux transporter CrcB [Bacteroidota bacterium]
MIRLLLMIGTGGFVGSVARFLISRFFQNYATSTFPYGTFVVNILGCLLIGFFYGMSEKGDFLTAEWRMFLTVGFCGGFTTFSTFAGENIALLKDGNFFYFALYTSLSVFLGLTATYFGNIITKLI